MNKKIFSKNIENKKFANKNFCKVVFYNITIENTIFENCKFDATFFNIVKIFNTKFLNCSFNETLFSFSKIDKNSSFEHVFMQKTSFYGTKICNSNFFETKIETSNFSKSQMENSCKVMSCKFNDFFKKNIPFLHISSKQKLEEEIDSFYTSFVSKLKSDNNKTKILTAPKVKKVVKNQNFSKLILSEAYLSHKTFINCKFDYSLLSFLNINDSIFMNSSFNRACLGFTNFQNCDFQKCNLKEINGYQSKFKDCNISANLKLSNFSFAKFDNNIINESRFDACMFKCNKFYDNQITKSNFSDCAFYDIEAKNNVCDNKSLYAYTKTFFNSLIYLSIRESDGAFADYKKSISVFGEGKKDNTSLDKLTNKRYNHNDENNFELIDDFFLKQMDAIKKKNPNARFVYYGKNRVSLLPPEVQKNIQNQSDPEIINILDSKFSSKQFMKNYVACLELKFLKGKDISFDMCQKLFNKNIKKFVIQAEQSSGGAQTFLFTETNEKRVLKELAKQKTYSITKFVEGPSINIHLLIAEKNYLIMPPSIQVIDSSQDFFEYIGCDYPAYKKIISKQKNQKVLKFANTIAKVLQKNHYKGICGVDCIAGKDDVYFMEINPRFQASTNILNLSLKENNLPSMNELDTMCFTRKSLPTLPNFDVEYSKMSFIEGQKNNVKLKVYKTLKDGFSKNEELDKGVYLYSNIYKGSILEALKK